MRYENRIKFCPRTGLEGTEGKLRYSSTLSFTSALYGALVNTADVVTRHCEMPVST